MSDAPARPDLDRAWAKLRRRKVVQWSLAYAAGAWALLQVFGFAADAFEWPAVTKQLAMLAFGFGLPIAVTIAWYHGDRGHQRVTRAEILLLALLGLAAGASLWIYAARHPLRTAPVPATASSGGPASAKDAKASIAVLPFENRSAQQQDAFFVEGIHDDILTQLAKISAIKVISRTSVERFRDTQLPLREIARQLGVRSILEGGVQRAGDRVRVNVQLIDASSDTHLWAETYDRELTAANIFAIQSELATSIAGALRAALTPAERVRVNAVSTGNLEAWEAYQLGQQRMAKRSTSGLADAEQFFRRATQLDPKFALAWVGLADVLRLQTMYSGVPLPVGLAASESAIRKALQLDPDSPEAVTSAAAIAFDRDDRAAADAGFRRALALNPNYATTHHWYSGVLRDWGRIDEAVAEGRRALELDPLSPIINMHLANVLLTQGDFDAAVAMLHKTIEIEPGFPTAYIALGAVEAYAHAAPLTAMQWLEKASTVDPDSREAQAAIATLDFDLARDERAEQVLRAALADNTESAFPLDAAATFAAARGDWARARDMALRALQAKPRDTTALRVIAAADLHSGDLAFVRGAYEAAFPQLFVAGNATIDWINYEAAIDVAPVLQRLGEAELARRLLEVSARFIEKLPRLGPLGYGLADAQVRALLGDRSGALAALESAVAAGWRGPAWRYYRDADPNLASIRGEPRFRAAFARLEQAMAQSRADAPATR